MLRPLFQRSVTREIYEKDQNYYGVLGDVGLLLIAQWLLDQRQPQDPD